MKLNIFGQIVPVYREHNLTEKNWDTWTFRPG